MARRKNSWAGMAQGKKMSSTPISALPKLKAADVQRFDNLYVRWEAELNKHEARSREYFIG